jgi:hypothetical protein
MDKSKKLDQLVGSIEDLLARLPLGSNPELAALRDQVDAEILAAWTVISRESARRREIISRAARPPWAIVGLAILAGLCASILVNRTALARAFKQS